MNLPIRTTDNLDITFFLEEGNIIPTIIQFYLIPLFFSSFVVNY